MGSSHTPQGVGRSPPGRLLLVALPSGHALPSLPERHRELRKIFLLRLLPAGVEGGDSRHHWGFLGVPLLPRGSI